ncbi:MAG: hypothetical protein IKV97_07000, partial [Clostridia bacterium]|nr:hypothetical protein [Clostridia bacterium]
MKKTRKELVTASVEITLIFILTVALVIMFAAYCGSKNTSKHGETLSFDFSNDYLQSQILSDENPAGILFPAFIGVVTDKYLAPEDLDTRKRLLKDALPFLTGAFSDVSTVLEFSSDSTRLDYINKNLYSAKNYLYINFANDIPAGAVIPCINGKTSEDTNHPFNMKELFIFCSRDGAISGATIDSKGNVSTLTVRDRTPLSFDTLRAYEDVPEMKKFEFVSAYDRKYPVMSSSVARNIAIAYTESGDFLTAGSSQVRNILTSFGFNP